MASVRTSFMSCNERERLAAEVERLLDAFIEEMQCSTEELRRSMNGGENGTDLGARLKVCRKELADHCRLHGCG